MSDLEEIRRRFQNDHFAMETTGVVIEVAQPEKSVCSLTLEKRHMNENDVAMGGAIFTLADIAFAVAANGYSEKKIISQQVSITFLSPARGRRLIAEASCLRSGRTTVLYSVEVKDEQGVYVAHATVNGFVIKEE